MLERVLMTVVTLGYSLVPTLADLNWTHATNPLWTGHARYHVVWQVSSYILIAALGLYLIWTPGPTADERFLIATGIAVAVYGGFFTALGTMGAYEGQLADTNGVPSVTIFGVTIDLNVLVFVVLILFLVASQIAFWR